MPPEKNTASAKKPRYIASVPVRRRRTRKSKAQEGLSEDPDASAPEPKKPGRKCQIVGERAKFVDERFDEFLEVYRGDRGDQNSYWDKFFKEYWAAFPWNLPFDADPNPDLYPPPQETDETPEIVEKKTKTITKARKVSKSLELVTTHKLTWRSTANNVSH